MGRTPVKWMTSLLSITPSGHQDVGITFFASAVGALDGANVPQIVEPISSSGMPSTRPILLLLLSLPLVIGVACSNENRASNGEESKTIPFDKEGRLAILQQRDTLVVIDLEIADTDSARQRGMMQRDGFPSDTSGMLFPFPKEEDRSFWMANTPVALDLFFVNADSQIVSITKYAEPNTADQIPSQGPAKYVLETPAGFADSYGILEGDRVRWKRTDN